MFCKAWHRDHYEYLNHNLILNNSLLQPFWTKAERELKFAGRENKFIISTQMI